MGKRLFVGAVAAILILVAGRYVVQGGLGGRDSSRLSAEVEPLPVKTVQVELVDSYAVRRAYTGTVRARRSTSLGFERGGRVVAMLVEEGDRVDVDQALARLDTRRLEAQTRELEARRAQATARLDELVAGPRRDSILSARARVEDLKEQVNLFRLQRDRAERLLEEQVVSRDEFDVAASSEKQLLARLEAAKFDLAELMAGTRNERVRAQEGVIEQLEASLDLVNVDLEDSVLRAPFAGVVIEKSAEVGRIIGAGEPLVRLLEDASPEAWIGLPVDMAQSVTVGSTYPVKVGGAECSATALAVLPEINRVTRTLTVILKLHESDAPLVEGEIVRLVLEKEVAERGLWVPTTALTRGLRGLWNCYVVAKDGVAGEDDSSGVAEYRQVEMLYAEGDRLFVRGTLRDGERIVSEGTHRIVVGQRVRAVDGTPQV